MSKITKKTQLLQDLTCRNQYCDEAYRCWDVIFPKCCWPPENDHRCRTPGLPPGWTRPGSDPAGVSNNMYITVTF